MAIVKVEKMVESPQIKKLNSQADKLVKRINKLDASIGKLDKQIERLRAGEIFRTRKIIETFIKKAPKKTKDGIQIRYLPSIISRNGMISGYRAIAIYSINNEEFMSLSGARAHLKNTKKPSKLSKKSKTSSKTVTLAQAKKMVKDAEKAVMRKLLKDKITQQPTQPPAVEAKDII